MKSDQLLRAGAAVTARMAELGLSPADVQRRASLDFKTLQGLREGTRMPTLKTRSKVEKALDWPPGEIERRGRGEVPSEQSGPRTSAASALSTEELLLELAFRLGRASAGATTEAVTMAAPSRMGVGEPAPEPAAYPDVEGLAARTVPGGSKGRRLRDAQDEAAESPSD